MSDDPYCYSGTSVLRNELGIRDAQQLSGVEANLTRLRLVRLAAKPLPGDYDLAHLRAFHRVLFDAATNNHCAISSRTLRQGERIRHTPDSGNGLHPGSTVNSHRTLAP